MKKYLENIIIVVSVMAICFVSACTGYTIGKEELKKEQEIMSSVSDPFLVEPKGGNNISLIVADIAMEEYEAYGVSTMAESAKTITATVSPSYATNKAVDYSIAWVNASSEWATGKTVTDYVTVSQASDGALTATVTCLQAFGESIEITCTARSNSQAKATCLVDCQRVVDEVWVTFGEYTYKTSRMDGGRYAVSYSTVSSATFLQGTVVQYDSEPVIDEYFDFIYFSEDPWTIDVDIFGFFMTSTFEYRTALRNAGLLESSAFLNLQYSFDYLPRSLKCYSSSLKTFAAGYSMPLSLLGILNLNQDLLINTPYSSLTSMFGAYYNVAKEVGELDYPHYVMHVRVGDNYFGAYIYINPDSIEIAASTVTTDVECMKF